MHRSIGKMILMGLVAGLSGGRVPAAEEDANHFTHGPVLGRLSAQGIGVWARTARTGEFVVKYGTAPDALDQLSPPAATELAHDNTGWVHIDGLKPNTKYFYELAFPGSAFQTGKGGSFRTLPDSAELVDAELNPRGLFNFSFEFACGNNQNSPSSNGPGLPAFQTMLDKLDDKIDFAILNGDWLYESQRSFSPAQWLSQVNRTEADLPQVVQAAPTIVGVWENYKHFYNQGEHLVRWHREVPSFFTFDDHEILNDIWGAGTPGLRDRRAVFRDIGVQAWYDYLGWSNPPRFDQPVHFGTAQLKAGSDVLTDSAGGLTRLDLSQGNNLLVQWGTPTAGVNDNALDGVGGDP
ncbi:MAG: alkaline phosphatase D family protein, partial [Planctomycetaceae bacterium]